MNRYKSYKKTGIDWVGEVPSHWETLKPKYKLNRVTRPIDENDEVITCFRDGEVTLRKNRREDGFTNSIKEHGYQQIKPGDLVVHEMDGFEGAIGISDSKGKSTPVYTVIEPNEKVDLRYISYLLREMSKTGKIESLARSIRERTTDFRWNMWSIIPFPFPPINEQKSISDYLDKKNKKIDKLINKIQKKIQLFNEQRASLIYKYVTKGLDINVEMKESGVQWIGKIPNNWSISKVGRHFKLERGRVISNTEISDNMGPYPVYSSQTKNNGKMGSINSFDFEGEYVSWTTDGAYAGTCFHRKGKFNVTNVCGLLSSFELEINYNFLSLFLNIGSKGYVRTDINPKLMNDMMSQIPLLVVPIEEQNEIVSKIKLTTDKLNKIILKEENRVNILKEYRRSIISSAVTGKIRLIGDKI